MTIQDIIKKRDETQAILMENTKACIACRHLRLMSSGYDYTLRCVKTRTLQPHALYGTVALYADIESARRPGEPCGPTASRFERAAWWRVLLRRIWLSSW